MIGASAPKLHTVVPIQPVPKTPTLGGCQSLYCIGSLSVLMFVLHVDAYCFNFSVLSCIVLLQVLHI